MESSDIRVGVVGLGKMGLLHASIFNSLEGSRVAAVAEPSALARNALSGLNSSIQVFRGVEEMLDGAELGAVVITTPVADHVPVAMECVRRGIPFFVEKPLAASGDQAMELAAALRETPMPHMVGYMTRFVDSFEKACAVVQSGCLGRLQRVTATIYVSQLFARGQGWRYDQKVSGGGVLLSQGSHVLDLLTWYLGPAVRVNAEIFPIYSREIEDSATVLLEFESGLRGWLDCCWSVRFRRTVETTIDILGENGSLVVTDDAVRLFLDEAAGGMPAGRTAWTAADLYRGVEVDVGGPQYTREDQAFLGALRTGSKAEPDCFQALHVQQIVDAAYASSLAKGAPEAIPHERVTA